MSNEGEKTALLKQVISGFLEFESLWNESVAALQPSLPQDVEEWIERSQYWSDSRSGRNSEEVVPVSDLRAFLAGKVLVPAAEMRKQIIDCLLSTSGLSDGATADAIVSMLTASKGE